MYGLPDKTIINKPLYKKAFFEKFNLKATDRDRFDADISKMHILAWVSSQRLHALSDTGEVKEFYVMLLEMKHPSCAEQNLQLLQRNIGRKMLFALQYENDTQLCLFHNQWLCTVWKPTEEMTIPLKGLSIDDAWRNIVAEIGGLDTFSDQSLEEQIENNAHREKLLKQIETLEKQMRIEKQTRRKFELHQRILKLKEELHEE